MKKATAVFMLYVCAIISSSAVPVENIPAMDKIPEWGFRLMI
ncbi:MAG: hypothetical protein PHF64_09540 [Methanoregula sp.]|nr:hypothetical protein [Methanoregula sp.]